MCCEDRETLLELGAVARRAFWNLASTNQRLELVITLLARVLEQRHVQHHSRGAEGLASAHLDTAPRFVFVEADLSVGQRELRCVPQCRDQRHGIDTGAVQSHCPMKVRCCYPTGRAQ